MCPETCFLVFKKTVSVSHHILSTLSPTNQSILCKKVNIECSQKLYTLLVVTRSHSSKHLACWLCQQDPRIGLSPTHQNWDCKQQATRLSTMDAEDQTQILCLHSKYFPNEPLLQTLYLKATIYYPRKMKARLYFLWIHKEKVIFTYSSCYPLSTSLHLTECTGCTILFSTFFLSTESIWPWFSQSFKVFWGSFLRNWILSAKFSPYSFLKPYVSLNFQKDTYYTNKSSTR